MSSRRVQWRRPVVVAAAVVASAFLQVAWALIVFFVTMLLSLATWSPNVEASRNPWTVILSILFLPATIIPVSYLPFVAREIIHRQTEDAAASWLGYSLAMMIAVILSLWLTWYFYGSSH